MGAERLSGIRDKIERAKQHILHLEAAVAAFKNPNPYSVATQRDLNTRELVYYIASIQDVPTSISILVGDAIQNLRSALDHLAFQLFLVGGGSPSGGRDIYFPCIDPTKNEAAFKRKVEGMRQDAIDAIRATEAYQGGKGHKLWALHGLNITDKHRLLLTVGIAYRKIKLATYNGPSLQLCVVQTDDGAWHDVTGMPDHPLLDQSVDLKNPICPLKAGSELYRSVPGDEVNQHADFGFDISLDEPEVAKGEPILVTIHQFANLVSDIVNQFSPLVS